MWNRIFFYGLILANSTCLAQSFFQPGELKTVQTNVSSMFFYDEDLDGYGDIQIIHSADQLTMGILKGQNNGAFENEIIKSKDAGYHLTDFGDLNKDGIIDKVMASYWNNGFKVFLGNKPGSYAAGVYYYAGIHGGRIKIVDIDKDGQQDIITTTSGSGNPLRMHVFRGNGTGVFNSQETYQTLTTTPRNMFIIDKNNDGLTDVLITTSFPEFVILFQKPDKSFKTIYYMLGVSAEVVPAHFNDDDKIDVLVSYNNYMDTDSMVVWEGGNDTSFAEKHMVMRGEALFAERLQVSDVNRDGLTDFSLMKTDWYGESSDTILFKINKGNFRFETAPEFTIKTNDTLYSYLVADVNNDKKTDVIALCKDKSLQVFLNGAITGIPPEEYEDTRFYPNPVEDKLYVSGVYEGKKAEIVDIYGKVHFVYTIKEQFLDLSMLPKGIYFLHFPEINEAHSHKFIKK